VSAKSEQANLAFAAHLFKSTVAEFKVGLSGSGGVFVVLLCGLALAIIVAVLEFCWNSRKNAQTDRVTNTLISAFPSAKLKPLLLLKKYLKNC